MKTHISAGTSAIKTSAIKKRPNILARTFLQYKRNFSLFAIFIPVIIYFAVFRYGPMYGMILAFKNYNFGLGIFKSPWVGLDNFRTMFQGKFFLNVFFNTIIINFYKLIFVFPAPILFALLLNELRNKTFTRITQTVASIPYFLSWVVLGGIITQMLSPSIGPVGYIFNAVGLKPINFLADSHWFRTTVVASSIWQSAGWNAIIYLAAMAGISHEMYEAAIVDGANRLKCVIHITLPSLMPAISIMFIMGIGNIIYDDFDQIYNLYNVAVYNVGDVISTYVYRVGLANMDYGYGTAVGMFRNVIAVVMVLSVNYFIRKRSEYSLM